jgi:hypothetical protein
MCDTRSPAMRAGGADVALERELGRALREQSPVRR